MYSLLTAAVLICAQPPAKKDAGPEWIGAAKGHYDHEGLTIRLTKCGVGLVQLETATGQAAESNDPYLLVLVELSTQNAGRKYDYRTWADRPLRASRVTLKDDLGNAYKATHFGVTTTVRGQVDGSASVYVGSPVKDWLVFERPVAKATELFLELPLDNVGGRGVARFKFAAPPQK